MRPVVLESPYAGQINRNTAYARACVAHAISQGDAPFASHLLYTQPGVLADLKPDERNLGIECGFAWGDRAEAAVVYIDLGISSGMKLDIERYKARGLPVEERSLADWKWEPGRIDAIREHVLCAIGILDEIAKSSPEIRRGLVLMLVGLIEAIKSDALGQLEAAHE